MRVDLGVSRVVAKVVISYKNWIYGLEVWIGEFRKMRRKAEIKYAVKSDLSYVHFQQVMTVAIEAIQTLWRTGYFRNSFLLDYTTDHFLSS